LISIDFIYGQNTLVPEVGTDFAAFAQTSNQLAAAKQLDKVALDPREAQLISFLSNESVVNLALRSFHQPVPGELVLGDDHSRETLHPRQGSSPVGISNHEI
jgi:hypothetical protein